MRMILLCLWVLCLLPAMGAAASTVMIGEVQSYGDHELKADAFASFTDKLCARLAENGVRIVGRQDVTNEAGRHGGGSAEAQELSLIHMDAIVRGHRFDHAFAGARLIHYADETLGRRYFYDEARMKSWQGQTEAAYPLGAERWQAAERIARRYGADYLLFVNLRDVDVRLRPDFFASRTDLENRGKKLLAQLDYYMVNPYTGRVYEGHVANKKTAQLVSFAIGRAGKGMNVDELLNQVLDRETQDLVLAMQQKGWLRAGRQAVVGNGQARLLLAGMVSRVQPSAVTLQGAAVKPDAVLPVLQEVLAGELAGGRYKLLTADKAVTAARRQEAEWLTRTGEGYITPELKSQADYIAVAYLNDFSFVRSQNDLLGLGGKAETVHLELALRIFEAGSGKLVLAAAADSRRKSELKYNVIWQRQDRGPEDAVRAAAEIAAINLAAKVKAAM